MERCRSRPLHSAHCRISCGFVDQRPSRIFTQQTNPRYRYHFISPILTYTPVSRSCCNIFTHPLIDQSGCSHKPQSSTFRNFSSKALAHRRRKLLRCQCNVGRSRLASGLSQGRHEHPNVDHRHDESCDRVAEIFQFAHLSSRAWSRCHAFGRAEKYHCKTFRWVPHLYFFSSLSFSHVLVMLKCDIAALASQSLSIMIALIPYVREGFRRHLSPKQAVMLVEFDKLKRVSFLRLGKEGCGKSDSVRTCVPIGRAGLSGTPE